LKINNYSLISKNFTSGTMDKEQFTYELDIGFGPGLLVEIETGVSRERIKYQRGNHLQSGALKTNASGEVVRYEIYHPFGTIAYQAKLGNLGPAARKIQFAGKEKNEESGLYYFA